MLRTDEHGRVWETRLACIDKDTGEPVYWEKLVEAPTREIRPVGVEDHWLEPTVEVMRARLLSARETMLRLPGVDVRRILGFGHCVFGRYQPSGSIKRKATPLEISQMDEVCHWVIDLENLDERTVASWYVGGIPTGEIRKRLNEISRPALKKRLDRIASHIVGNLLSPSLDLGGPTKKI